VCAGQVLGAAFEEGGEDFFEVDASAVGVGAGDAGGVLEEVADGDAGARVGDAREEVGEGVVESEFAILLKAEDGRGRELLGDRRDLEEGGGCVGRLAFEISIAHRDGCDHLPVLRGQDKRRKTESL